MNSQSLPADRSARRGVEHADVIDLLLHDEKTDQVSLVMLEPRPWDGSDLRLYQLQEKINAYLSFALDGEMAEAYPSLIGKPLQLRIDCVSMPDEATTQFLAVVRDQIKFQGIDLEVVVTGTSCSCGP